MKRSNATAIITVAFKKLIKKVKPMHAGGQSPRNELNPTGKKQPLTIEGVDLSIAKWHVIDQERLLSWSPAVAEIEKNMVLLIEW